MDFNMWNCRCNNMGAFLIDICFNGWNKIRSNWKFSRDQRRERKIILLKICWCMLFGKYFSEPLEIQTPLKYWGTAGFWLIYFFDISHYFSIKYDTNREKWHAWWWNMKYMIFIKKNYHCFSLLYLLFDHENVFLIFFVHNRHALDAIKVIITGVSVYSRLKASFVLSSLQNYCEWYGRMSLPSNKRFLGKSNNLFMFKWFFCIKILSFSFF